MKFSIATEKPIINETGKVKLIPEWHNIMIFDKAVLEMAKACALTKGSKVRVDGELSYRKRAIKDTNGDVITTVKDAFIVAGIVVTT